MTEALEIADAIERNQSRIYDGAKLLRSQAAEIERLNLALLAASEGTKDREYAEKYFRQAEQMLTIDEAALRAEVERLQSEVVNAKQLLSLRMVALNLAVEEADKYRYLREHHAKAILGSCFWLHPTGDGQDDLDKVVSDALENKHD